MKRLTRKLLTIVSGISLCAAVAAKADIIAFEPFETTTSSSAADPENGLYWANVDSGDGSVAGDINRAARNGGIIGFGTHPWEASHTTYRPQASRLEAPLRMTDENGALRVLSFRGSSGGPSTAFRTAWRDLDDYTPADTYYQSAIIEPFTAESGHLPGGFLLLGFGNDVISDSSVMEANSADRFEGILWGFRANEAGDRLDLIVRATVDAADNRIEDFVLVEGVVQRHQYFVVVRVDVDTEGKDTVTVWVDPSITAGGVEPTGGVTFEVEAFSANDSITRFAMVQEGVLHSGGNNSVNRVGYLDAPTLGTTYASVTDVAEFFYQVYGTGEGQVSGEDLDRTNEDEWSLEPDALRLTATGEDYRGSFATAEMTHFAPGDDFGMRGTVTLDSLDAAPADNAVGHIVLDTDDPESFYFAHWAPTAGGGSELRIREGVEGQDLASVSWEGLRPTQDDPADGVGTTFTLTTLGVYDDGGELDLTFRVEDGTGYAASVTAPIPDPFAGGRFGFGAWHRAAESPSWLFHEFGMTERWLLDYRPIAAPFSYTFGTGEGLDGLDDLLLAHPRPEAWTLETEGLRFARDTGSWESSITAASVENYQPGQDFLLEAELSLDQLANVGLNRLGFAVLGAPHDPFAAPFQAGDDNGYYGLMWVPAADAETSQLRIRQGFNGTDLETATWTGMHPSANDPNEGIGTVYTMEAEGAFDEEGALELSFTLTDANGHTQTVSTTIANPITGTTFGIGGRTHGDQDPEAVFYSFGMELGESPAPVGPTFETWRAEHFTDVQLADEEISGPAADPLGDGVANLLKYSADFSPWTFLTHRNLVSPGEVDGELQLTYFERTDVEDIDYIVEVSEDLQSWNRGGNYVEEVARIENGAIQEVTVRALLPEGADRGFMRLVIEER